MLRPRPPFCELTQPLAGATSHVEYARAAQLCQMQRPEQLQHLPLAILQQIKMAGMEEGLARAQRVTACVGVANACFFGGEREHLALLRGPGPYVPPVQRWEAAPCGVLQCALESFSHPAVEGGELPDVAQR